MNLFSMSLYNRTCWLLYCMLWVTASYGQSEVEKYPITHWQAQIAESPLKVQEELSAYLRTHEDNPHLWLVLSLAYDSLANATSPFESPNMVKSHADSALFSLQQSEKYSSKKSLRKFEDFYQIALHQSNIHYDSVAAAFAPRKQFFTQRSKVAAQLDSLQYNATMAYQKAAATFQANAKRYTLPEMAMFATDTFTLHIRPIIEHYRRADSLLQLSSEKALATFGHSLAFLSTDRPSDWKFTYNVLSRFNFSRWYDTLLQIRQTEVLPHVPATQQRLQRLYTLAEQIKNDTVGTTLSATIPNTDSLQQYWDQLGNGTLAKWINYQQKKIRFMQGMVKEKAYFNYKHEQEAIFRYYHKFQTDINLLQSKLDSLEKAVKAGAWHYAGIVLQKMHSGEADFLKTLQQEKSYLNTRYEYCALRMRDQLLYENIELKYLPRYSEYKGRMLPLFEQSMHMVVEKGDYVTTRILKDAQDNLYITGYRNMDRKEGFVARIVGERVAWMHRADQPHFTKEEPLDSYGIMLSKGENGGCLAVMQFQTASDTTAPLLPPQLIAFDSSGAMYESFHLPIAEHKVERVLPLRDTASLSFLTASLGNVPEGQLINTTKWPKRNQRPVGNYNGVPILNQNQTQTVEALVITQLTAEGIPQWSTSLPLKGELSGLVEFPDRYVLVCNQQGEQEDLRRVLLIALDKKGKVLAQKVVPAKASCFATRTLKLDAERVLVVGFEGKYDINNLEQKSMMNLLLTPNLELIDSTLD